MNNKLIAALLALLALLLPLGHANAQAKAAPITMVINQSPWFDGFKPPETWDELMANAVKLNDPPRVYGFVHFDDRAFTMVDFSNFMFSFGGDVFADPKGGDFRVAFNSPRNLKALEYYIELGKKG